jgi:hypothetical protein
MEMFWQKRLGAEGGIAALIKIGRVFYVVLYITIGSRVSKIIMII